MARGNKPTNKHNTRKTTSKRPPGRIRAGGVKVNAKSKGLSRKQKATNKAQGKMHENTRAKQHILQGIQGMKNRQRSTRGR